MRLDHSITRLAQVFEKDGIIFALAGGFAFSIHIIPRATTDIDFIVFTKDSLHLVEQSIKKVFPDLIAHKHPIKAGIFDVWRFVGIDNEETIIDIMLSRDDVFAEKVVTRISYLNYNNAKIPIVSIEDIYIMKKKSIRHQDIHDCKMIEEIQGESLDWSYIRQWTDDNH